MTKKNKESTEDFKIRTKRDTRQGGRREGGKEERWDGCTREDKKGKTQGKAGDMKKR